MNHPDATGNPRLLLRILRWLAGVDQADAQTDIHPRLIVSALLNKRVLIPESQRAPLRLAFPTALASRWMPVLLPDYGS